MSMTAGIELSAVWTKTANPQTIPEDAASVQDHLAPHVQWRRCVESLMNLKVLRDDWDGLGALAPDPRMIDSAIKVVRSLQADGFAVPGTSATPTGGVFLEWQGREEYLEAEIEQPNVVNWMRQRPPRAPEHWREELATGRDDSSSVNASLRFQGQVACGSTS